MAGACRRISGKTYDGLELSGPAVEGLPPNGFFDGVAVDHSGAIHISGGGANVIYRIWPRVDLQEKYQVAGKQTLAQIDTQQDQLDDVLGRTLILMKFERVNYSTGKTEFMDGAHVMAVVSSDSDGNISPFQGYIRNRKGGDVIYFKLAGTTT